MAPRWMSSRQSAWGLASTERALSTGTLIALALVIFIVGAGLGYLVKGIASRDPIGSVPKSALVNSAVIDPNVAAITSADRSVNGAVKAATSFVSGLPNLALVAADQRERNVDSLLTNDAPPLLRQNILAVLNATNIRIQSSGSVTAKVLLSPVSYKTVSTQPDKVTVSLWFVTVYLDANGPQFQSVWSTDSVDMVFTDKWRVAGLRIASGPTPPLLSPNAESSTYQEAADVLQGGFAYRYALSR